MRTKFRSAIVAIAFAGSLATAPAFAASCSFDDCGSAASQQAAIDQGTSTQGISTQGISTEGSGFRKIAAHGSWTALTDGEMTLIIDQFNDGTKFAIAYDGNGKSALLVSRPTWQMTKGQTFTLKIDVDGEVYSGTVTALDATTLDLDGVSKEFVAAITNGRKGQIRIGAFTADMETLTDASATMADAVRYQRASKN